ncbi:MAG TPA: rhodanese-like domain-containing protein [Candidatus Acidoferrales bacterium]|jgi:rhodanese-related sulfurtransferase|nr:rhodanese-like domain-containing protein [Candidatus Acidoferrales bacterium]
MSRENITAAELREREDVTVIDIRKNPDDRRIPGSLRMEGADLESTAPPIAKDQPVVLYCGSGNSCTRIAATLRERGYDAVALDGGYAAWKGAGFATEPRPS